jgi:hypothetical protein
MRSVSAILFASTAALLSLAVPTLARNSDGQKPSEAPVTSSCHSYQQAGDGSWKELPRQELGSPARTQPKSATRKTDQDTR